MMVPFEQAGIAVGLLTLASISLRSSSQGEWESAKNPCAGLLIPKGSAVTTGMLANPSSSDQWTRYRDPTDEEFLYTDPASVSPTYRSIDEFTDWLEKTN